MSDAAPVLEPPRPLSEAHECAGFDSGEAVLDDWLRRRAWANQQVAASRTYVICPAGTVRVVGYAALSMGQILAHEATGERKGSAAALSRFQAEPLSLSSPLRGAKCLGAIPAIILGRLAIDRGWQGKGVGRALLADVVARSLRASREISARLVVVHAFSPATEAFYLNHGFTRLPVEAPTLALDLVKFGEVME